MRKSQQKTPIAVIRSIIGMSAQEFAKLIGRTVHTVKSLESGRLPLSEDLAMQISGETGVLVESLLDYNPDYPPMTGEGFDFTLAAFEDYRAELAAGKTTWEHKGFSKYLGKTLTAIAQQAEDKPKFNLLMYRAEKFFDKLCEEFDLEHPSGPKS